MVRHSISSCHAGLVSDGTNHGSRRNEAGMVNWRKDSGPRLRQVSRAEYDLRCEYSESDMTLDEFNKKLAGIREKRHERKHPSG